MQIKKFDRFPDSSSATLEDHGLMGGVVKIHNSESTLIKQRAYSTCSAAEIYYDAFCAEYSEGLLKRKKEASNAS